MKRTYRSTLRAESKSQTIARILDATVRLHGQGITDIDAVAREAGVSVATVRKYFPTREQLFRGCTDHFLKMHPPPSLEGVAQIPDPGDRLFAIVRMVYGLHEAASGHSWLAYQLQDESPVMAQTGAMVNYFIGAAVDVMVQGWPGVPGSERDATLGFVRGLLTPLTYRALRLTGGLSHDDAVWQTTLALARLLHIAVPE